MVQQAPFHPSGNGRKGQATSLSFAACGSPPERILSACGCAFRTASSMRGASTSLTALSNRSNSTSLMYASLVWHTECQKRLGLPLRKSLKLSGSGPKNCDTVLSLAHDPTDRHPRHRGSPICMQTRLSSAYRGRFACGMVSRGGDVWTLADCVPAVLTLSQSAMITVSGWSGFR